jgi:uncharacterized protein (TIGR03118 family)
LALDGNLLYAANFGLQRIDVYNSSFQPTTVSGGFHDPNLPSGYAPFNIQNIGNNLYVTFAKTSGGKDEVDGPGLGYVDEFDANGVLLKRLVSNGPLNAPWAVVMAPAAGFGIFSGDLLVGNFGDGMINVFDPANGSFLGALDDASGKPISIQGLWGLSFGNGAHGQLANALYFNAGIAGPGNVEDHGLFGSLVATPEPSSIALMCGAVLFGIGGAIWRKSKN